MSDALVPFGDKGPCAIVWDWGGDDPLYLGEFLGQVNLKMETGFSPVEVESQGGAAVDAIYTGSNVTLEIPLTRSSFDALAAVFNTESVPLLDGTGETLIIKNQIGCNLYDDAKAIVIKPMCNNVISEDAHTWTWLYKCVPVPGINWIWDRSTQRITPVKFLVFPLQESAAVLGHFGQVGMESGSLELGV